MMDVEDKHNRGLTFLVKYVQAIGILTLLLNRFA
jgi:hypothetical protein